ncbi:ComF family protein [Bacillus sp. AGMB 02131]|uniref:ComF family protein n=1 Tax=Peribacillus faecalis TaxID=2772559 RepID=A0A927HCJ7_9BACI|nr:ComF family protein [Peribacillus faecalis]MBD3108503.1 ComF family protein [Peribacillus faecalis]
MFNEVCLYCQTVSSSSFTWTHLFDKNSLCENCRRSLEHLVEPFCKKCCRMLSEKSIDNICYDCVRWENNSEWSGVLECNISFYQYNDFMKELIARFKYRGDYTLAKIFATDIKKVTAEMKVDLYIPIPLSETRLSERGFNQSEALLAVAGLPVTNVLSRKHSEKQSKKSREERMQQANLFEIQDLETINGKQILLMDDIYTTGSTIRHAAKVLKNAGAARIISMTLSR